VCGCVGVCVVRGGGRETARVVVPQSFVEFARGGTKLTSLESLLDTQPHRPRRRGRCRAARSSSSSTRAIERVSFALSLGSSEFHQSALASRCSSLRAGSVVRFSLDIASLRGTSISPRGIEWGTSSLCLDSL